MHVSDSRKRDTGWARIRYVQAPIDVSETFCRYSSSAYFWYLLLLLLVLLLLLARPPWEIFSYVVCGMCLTPKHVKNVWTDPKSVAIMALASLGSHYPAA